MWWISKLLWWRQYDNGKFLQAPLKARLLSLTISDTTHGADSFL